MLQHPAYKCTAALRIVQQLPFLRDATVDRLLRTGPVHKIPTQRDPKGAQAKNLQDVPQRSTCIIMQSHAAKEQ
jgi:hypothetical protein